MLINGQTTTFRLHGANGERFKENCLSFRFPSNISMSMSLCPCFRVILSPCIHVHVSTFPKFRKRKTELTENGNFVRFMQTETANFSSSVANGNGKRTFVFLGRPTTNGKRRMLFQKTCPSMIFVRNSKVNPNCYVTDRIWIHFPTGCVRIWIW